MLSETYFSVQLYQTDPQLQRQQRNLMKPQLPHIVSVLKTEAENNKWTKYEPRFFSFCISLLKCVKKHILVCVFHWLAASKWCWWLNGVSVPVTRPPQSLVSTLLPLFHGSKIMLLCAMEMCELYIYIWVNWLCNRPGFLSPWNGFDLNVRPG